MENILVLVVIATAAAAIANRDVRSPGGSSWQGNSGVSGGPSAGFSRSSGGSWSDDSGSTSASGWRGTSAFGFSARSRSENGNRSPSSSGWSQSGYNSNGGYGGNSFGTSPEWNDIFADSTVIESLNSSNSWYEPGLSFRPKNGWQSSVW